MVIMCPYCSMMQQFDQADICNNCHKRLPRKYLEGSSRRSPIYLGTFGLKNHGKTAFLSSLTLSAEQLYKISPRAFSDYLDDNTQKKIKEWRKMERDGSARMGETPSDIHPTPLLMMVNNFPSQCSQVLVAYDLAGEVVDKAGSNPEYLRVLQKVNTTWFIISLYDILNHNQAGYSMGDLFNIYQQAMAQWNIPIRGKNILVLYTKADLLLKIQDELQLPIEVSDYLADDEYDQIKDKLRNDLKPFNEDEYFLKMHEISKILSEYTKDYVEGGGAFIAMAESYGAQVYFTINSAYGGEPNLDGTIGVKARRIRVLDSLIWAIRLNAPDDSELEVALILHLTAIDAGIVSQVREFYQVLTSLGGHVTTYYVGQIEPAFSVGTPPSHLQPASRLSLIGPVLDHLKSGTTVVLLTDNGLPIDFDDFSDSRWLDSLLVVAPRKEILRAWLEHRAALSQNGDVEQIVCNFFRQLAARKKEKA